MSIDANCLKKELSFPVKDFLVRRVYFFLFYGYHLRQAYLPKNKTFWIEWSPLSHRSRVLFFVAKKIINGGLGSFPRLFNSACGSSFYWLCCHP